MITYDYSCFFQHLSIMTFVAFGLFAAGILGYVFVGEVRFY